MLSINFMPNAIYQPEHCIRTTLAAARTHGFPIQCIIFETVEGELIEDAKWLAEVLRAYQAIGFLTAIDDFGAGFAGLNLLADFQPDIIKLDMALVRGVDASRPRQAIVRSVARMGEELGISILAEGVETVDEFLALQAMGIHLMQGYLFGKPRFEACAVADDIAWPQSGSTRGPLTPNTGAGTGDLSAVTQPSCGRKNQDFFRHSPIKALRSSPLRVEASLEQTFRRACCTSPLSFLALRQVFMKSLRSPPVLPVASLLHIAILFCWGVRSFSTACALALTSAMLMASS